MIRFGLVFCLLVAAVCAAKIPDQHDTRIIGGNTAHRGQFPYTASIRLRFTHVCGGSIIGKRWVLSSAHCITNQIWFLLRIGISSISSELADFYEIVFMEVHPLYDNRTLAYDIALLHTPWDMQLGEYASIIEIAKNPIGAGVSAVIAGWGRTSESGGVSLLLQYLEVKTISDQECADWFGDTNAGNSLGPFNICTFREEGRGTCAGDNGGPLVADGKLIGVTSWGIACARGYPDVFVRLSDDKVQDWIQEVLDYFA